MVSATLNLKLLLGLTVLVTGISTIYIRTTDSINMKCAYGERGSLTATCVNATPSFFKSTPYRFDHLDETLRCVNCTLQTLDSGTFDISGNQIRILDLQYSQIESIRQRAFVGLIFLEKLSLAHNNIKSIYPGTFTGVKKITEIDLSENAITILSENGFMELLNLNKLNLRNNKIATIQKSAFNGLPNLQILDLQHNEISRVKDVFNNLTSLQSLNLDYNSLVSFNGTDFQNLTALLELTMTYNNIRSIPEKEFVEMPKLRKLDLSYNLMDRVIAGSFDGLLRLEELDLAHNNIAEIPQKTLQNLPGLRNFNVSYNKLTIFQTGLYSGLPQLRVLNFSHNTIEDIEITGVFSLHNLDTLDLSFNNISDLDYVALIRRLPKIAFLNMEDNFLPCDLEKEMQDFFMEDNFKFILYRDDAGAIKCVDNPSNRPDKEKYTKDSLTGKPREQSGVNGAHVWIVIFLCVIFLLLVVLFYAQFRVYQELKMFSFKRGNSQANLLSSDLEARANEFLKE